MATQRIPLFGSLTIRNPESFSLGTDQLFVNCYPDVVRNPLSRQGKVFLKKRAGFPVTNSAGASYVATGGGVVWTGFSTGPKGVFCFLNGTTLGVYDDTGTIVGATIANIAGACRVNETLISNVANLTLIATKTADSLPHAWFIAEGGGGWTEITDADYPANQATPLTTVGNMVHMDGYAFIMDSKGQIWNSDVNSLANWTATSSLSAQSIPDGGVGLARAGKNLIAAFGTSSIEFFQNTGNATGSPLTRIPSATIKMGAQKTVTNSVESIRTVGDDIYFVGTVSDSGACGVYRLSGTTLTKVSNSYIDALCTQNAAGSNGTGISGSMHLDGQLVVVLYHNAPNGFPAFIPGSNFWFYLDTVSPTQITSCLGIGRYTYFVNESNFGSRGNKIFWGGSATTYQDDSSNYTMTIQTDNIDQGTQHRKFFTSAELVCDTQTTSGNISISWSDDDYATFSTARTIDPSTGTRRVTRLGSTKLNNNHKRAWKIEETVNRPFRGAELVLEYDVGEA